MNIIDSYKFGDADALAFINAAGLTDTAQITAINKLVTDLKSNGIWTKMKAIYPFIGGTATTHKWNLKDPRDLDAAFRLLFINTWTHSSNGAKPSFSGNAYANTFLIPFSVLTNNSNHLSYYSRTNSLQSGGSSTEIISYVSATSLSDLGIRRGGDSNRTVSQNYNDSTTSAYAIDSNSLGFYVASRTNNISNAIYKNGGLLNVNTTTNVNTIPNAVYMLGGTSISTIRSYVQSDRECAFATIGDGLTGLDVSNLNTIVQAYQTTLGRQV